MDINVTKKTIPVGFLLLIILILTIHPDKLSKLERIQQRGEIRVAMIATPPLYFPDESRLPGYGYEMASAYANAINTKLKIIRANTYTEMITLVKQGKAHIGISGSVPGNIEAALVTKKTHRKNKWHVIGNRKNTLPKAIEYIAPGTVVVAQGSRPALVIKQLKRDYASLFWLELPGGNTRQVLEQVNRGNFKLSIIDADRYTYYRYLYPEIKVAFTLPDEYSSYWVTKKSDDVSVFESIDKFINHYKSEGTLEKQFNTYFRHLDVFNYVDSLFYLKRIQITLPEYSEYFKTAAAANHFDERFLAAVSYQESHWDETAKSRTGVRGLMMLTLDTARRVGITDRLDPEQSITGGAKYLDILRASLPGRIKEPDRTWMTLAAYNVGLGHLEDARVLTESLGDNPDLWIDVEKHLPKLSQEQWYQKTKHGYARGHEPVEFVRQIRRYYDILRLYRQEELLEKSDKPLDLNKLNTIPPTI